MTPDEFVKKWKAVELKERSAAQSHFNDLCRMLEEPGPTDADPTGEWYCFERGATKSTGGEGWADVWKRGYFGWEYKGKRKDLNAAFAQLQYALALEHPPLLVVCDLDRFRIHTNWTNSASEVHEFALDDLRDGTIRQKLKRASASDSAPVSVKRSVSSSSRYASNPASEVIDEPRNCSRRRRSKSSLRAPWSASPVGSPIVAPFDPPQALEYLT